MSFLKGLLWFLFALVLIAVAMYITGNYALADYLTGFFLTLQPYLPLELNFDQFLVVVTVISLIIVLMVFSGCTLLLVYMGGRVSLAKQRQLGQASAAQREINHLKDEQRREHEELVTLGRALTKRLDKRVIIQGVVEAASRVTSVTQANSVVSLWLLHFETDTLHFEMGRYCDETLFAQAEYQLTDPSFLRAITTQKPWLIPAWEEQLACVRREKAAPLGSASSAMMIPLLIEDAVLGILLVFCHPDVLKSYEAKQGFYDAVWAELGLALSIAIQGELAILDRLTGTHNREYFMKRLIQELDRANRFQFPLSLLMIDIDNFKAVNDSLGHPQGDAVLKIIAKLIRKEVRIIDLVGRYGGEEFIVLLPETGIGEDAASAAGATTVGERMRQAVEEEFRGLQKPLNLTISVGVVVRRFPQDRAMDQRELIRLADEQLYRAKATGKNKVCVLVPETPQEVTE